MVADNVLWIGGPPSSGKTTVARALARIYGLRWYNADAHTWAHRDRAIAAGHRDAIRWEAMPVAERWSAPPADMLAMSLHHERGPMIVDDLRALPAAPLIIAEGTPVTPSITGDRAVWLLPTPGIQRARLGERNLRPGVLELYLLLGKEITTQVRESGARAVIVDGHTDPLAEVEEIFADAIAAGPRATTPARRRELSRYANRAIVDQHRAYFARPWTTGDAATTVRAFACECGRDGCMAEVELAVTDFPKSPDEPVLAPAHSERNATF